MHNQTELVTEEDIERVMSKLGNWFYRKVSFIVRYIDSKLD